MNLKTLITLVLDRDPNTLAMASDTLLASRHVAHVSISVTACGIFTRESMQCFACLSHHLGVRPSVHPLHCDIVSKRCKLESQNLCCGFRGPEQLTLPPTLHLEEPGCVNNAFINALKN